VFQNRAGAPRHPLEKSGSDHYHPVELIRSNLRLNISGEFFLAPLETQYEHAVAAVDAKEQKLKLFLDKNQVEEYN
jgi:hypothetical protein